MTVATAGSAAASETSNGGTSRRERRAVSTKAIRPLSLYVSPLTVTRYRRRRAAYSGVTPKGREAGCVFSSRPMLRVVAGHMHRTPGIIEELM